MQVLICPVICYILQVGQALVMLSKEAIQALKRKLADLKSQHRELDDAITRMTADVAYDQVEVQRLKKRKLRLKDEITQIESKLLPDIIA